MFEAFYLESSHKINYVLSKNVIFFFVNTH